MIIAVLSGSNLFYEVESIKVLPNFILSCINFILNCSKFVSGIIFAISSIISLSFLIAICCTKKKISQNRLQKKELHQEIEVLQKEREARTHPSQRQWY